MSERTISVGRQRIAADLSGPTAVAWGEYLAAARQLDAVRRAAVIAAGDQARSVQAGQEELTRIRARLAAQQERLRALGVPVIALIPSPPEVAAALRGMAAGPEAVLAELRAVRDTVDAADEVLTGSSLAAWPVSRRNLLVYAPLALLAPVLQLLLVGQVAGGTRPPAPLLFCGPLLGLLAFVTGWFLAGRLFRPSGGRINRTSWLGMVVCLGPALLTTLLVDLATG